MEKIREIISEFISQSAELSAGQVINAFLAVGDLGDIILIKNDGLRENHKFTIVIAAAGGAFESIRTDGDNLSEVLKTTLRKYAQVKAW